MIYYRKLKLPQICDSTRPHVSFTHERMREKWENMNKCSLDAFAKKIK
jgi:hypothetical protein